MGWVSQDWGTCRTQDKLQSGQSKGAGVRWPWLLALHSGAGEGGRLGPVASSSLQAGSLVLFLPSQPLALMLPGDSRVPWGTGVLDGVFSNTLPPGRAFPAGSSSPDLHACCDGELTLTLIHSDR